MEAQQNAGDEALRLTWAVISDLDARYSGSRPRDPKGEDEAIRVVCAALLEDSSPAVLVPALRDLRRAVEESRNGE